MGICKEKMWEEFYLAEPAVGLDSLRFYLHEVEEKCDI